MRLTVSPPKNKSTVKGAIMSARVRIMAILAIAVLGWPWGAFAQDPAQLQERVQAIRKNLAESRAALKHYEWIETTTVTLKDEQRSRIQKRCFYDIKGVLEKNVIGAPEEEKKAKRGLRGRSARKKKEEIDEAMKSTRQLIASYVPPDPAKVQACNAAGKASLTMIEPGKLARVDFKDYLKPGDLLGIEVDLEHNTIKKLTVASYLAKPGDDVAVDATFQILQEGITAPFQVAIDLKTTQVKTVIENSGHRRL
jgi:hypothetical protein